MKDVLRGVRGLLANSPAIAISTLALVFALGGGAGYAASTVTGAAKPVFHQLKLERGWSGHIEYTVVNGIVYLSGHAVNCLCDNGPAIMTRLPANLAPRYGIEIPVTFGRRGDGSIGVAHDGWIQPVPPPGRHFTYVSLSGASFAIGAGG